MNRSLIIATCDFLILSIIAIANFESTGDSKESTPLQANQSITESLEQLIAKDLKQKDQSASNLEKYLKEKDAALLASQNREKDLKHKQNTLKEQERLLKNKLKLEQEKLKKEQQESLKKKIELDRMVKKQNLTKSELENNKKILADKNKDLSDINRKLKQRTSEIQQQKKQLELANQNKKLMEKMHRELNERLKEQKKSTQNKENQLTEKVSRLKDIESKNMTQQKEILELKNKLNKFKHQQLTANFDKQKLNEKLISLQKTKEQNQQLISQLNHLNKNLSQSKVDLQNSIENMFRKSQTEVSNQLVKHIQKNSRELSGTIEEQLKNNNRNIEKKLKENKSLTKHQVFNSYNEKNVTIIAKMTQKGLFSENQTQLEYPAILILHNGKVYASLHANHSPLTIRNLLKNYKSLNLLLKSDTTIQFDIIYSLKGFPNILFLESNSSTNIKTMSIESNLYNHEQAILINPASGKYESFNMQFNSDKQLKIPSSLSSKLFGSLSTKSGMLVLSKNARLIGMTEEHGNCVLYKKIELIEHMRISKFGTETHKKAFNAWQKKRQ